MDENESILRTVEEHRQARRRLACFDQKRDDYVTGLKAIIDALEGREQGRPREDGDFEIGPRRGPEPPAIVTYPTAEEIAEVLEERDRLKTRIEDLARRRKELGID